MQLYIISVTIFNFNEHSVSSTQTEAFRRQRLCFIPSLCSRNVALCLHLIRTKGIITKYRYVVEKLLIRKREKSTTRDPTKWVKQEKGVGKKQFDMRAENMENGNDRIRH